jgi:NTP pyrophosphatase (non-canonical NTP hydrolase)
MESFDSMINLINESLQKIQEKFDIYQKEFFTQRPPEFFCLELNGEAGELANAEKKKWKGKPVADELFADEAADVLIALMNYSNARKIDLGKAVSDKLKKIEIKRQELAEKGEAY